MEMCIFMVGKDVSPIDANWTSKGITSKVLQRRNYKYLGT
jgi:hypothetical protein